MADADELRRELRELEARRTRGDVSERDFPNRRDDVALALSRAVVSARLHPGETILAEHHVVHSHFKLTGSLLRDPAQATVSLFATDRRIIRVRGSLVPGRPVSCDDADGTAMDELSYRAIAALARRSERRWGEVGVGLVAAVLALLLGRVLAVTGPLLMALGLGGVVHGLLIPSRSVELVAEGGAVPFVVGGLRRKSARRLLAVVGRAMANEDPRAPGVPKAEVGT